MVTVWTVHLHVRDFATRTPLHFPERFCHTDTSTLSERFCHTDTSTLSVGFCHKDTSALSERFCHTDTSTLSVGFCHKDTSTLLQEILQHGSKPGALFSLSSPTLKI